MIQPNIMDGIPDECGSYFVKHKESKINLWLIGYLSVGENGYAFTPAGQKYNDPLIEEEDPLDEWYWSEKIVQPDLDELLEMIKND